MASGSVKANEAPMFIWKRWSKSYTVNTGAMVHWTASDLGYAYPTVTTSDGTVTYSPVAITYVYTGSAYATLAYVSPFAVDSGYVAAINNNSGTNITSSKTFTMDILFARDELVEVTT